MRWIYKLNFFLVLFFLFCAFLSSPLSATDHISQPKSERLVLGIAPFMSPLALIKRMAPLRDYLSSELGIEVTIETTTDAKQFSQRTLAGRYDLLLTNPTFSLMVMDKGNFVIIATQKKKLAGYFIALEKSNIKTIYDLTGKSVGAPPKVGFMGQLITPYLNSLNFSEGKLPTVKHYNSHNATVSALRLGDIDAILIVSFMEKHLRKSDLAFRIIHKTPNYPGMTFAVRKDLAPKIENKLSETLYALDQNEKGKEVLSKISMPGYEKINFDELEKVRPFLPSKSEQ